MNPLVINHQNIKSRHPWNVASLASPILLEQAGIVRTKRRPARAPLSLQTPSPNTKQISSSVVGFRNMRACPVGFLLFQMIM